MENLVTTQNIAKYWQCSVSSHVSSPHASHQSSRVLLTQSAKCIFASLLAQDVPMPTLTHMVFKIHYVLVVYLIKHLIIIKIMIHITYLKRCRDIFADWMPTAKIWWLRKNGNLCPIHSSCMSLYICNQLNLRFRWHVVHFPSTWHIWF